MAKIFSWCFVVFLLFSTPAQAKGYTKEETNLSKLPRVRFHDKRLRKIWRVLAKQYKHIYAHAANDGYIFPNEKRDLLIHRNFMRRIYTIDRRNHKIRMMQKKHRRTRRRKRKPDYKEVAQQLATHRQRYEKMIRRFSCRHIPRYKKRYKRHCLPSSS